MCVRVCVRECVCVRERESERERQSKEAREREIEGGGGRGRERARKRERGYQLTNEDTEKRNAQAKKEFRMTTNHSKILILISKYAQCALSADDQV
jgi:hypothetical protein